MTSPAAIVDQILADFASRGHRMYGESVTEREHALQTALFARGFGEPDTLVAACLLHDYGHLMHDLGEDIAQRGVDAHHENITASALRQHFPPTVVEPARLHVEAKRYLCWKDPAYLIGMSPASIQSLQLQGGPMTDAEASEFEAGPHFDHAVRLRRYDDMGKIPGLHTPTLEDFRPLLESLVIA